MAMKKIFIITGFVFFIAGCVNNSSKEQTSDQNQTPAEQKEDPEVTKGLELVAASDCLTCHKVSEASVGPSYEAIAAKYPNNEVTTDTLTQRITRGSSGVWGTVPMAAHANLSKEDARLMVKYIMSLKK